uniref:Proteoglycan 4 n=1 Tax=Phallusia mammillata TaxID=59560 RepID=A0A6F9DD46_9ASCI|nr:proteoglycan 4 [Phallusia mammillata]
MEPESEIAGSSAIKVSEKTSNSKHVEFVQFKWNQEVAQYGDKLLQRLDEFRKKNMFFDVTLKAYDVDLAAHKVVLAACGGMFRSHFVDPKTKMILGNVTEVGFKCSAAGLRPILKFAYSGVLEITHENVLPTLQAAIITEMKEVQEICADIAISKLGWLLSFDGSLESLNTGHKSGKHLPNDINDVFDIIQTFLVFHVSHFPHDAKSEDTEEKDMTVYPGYREIKERFPELVFVYLNVVQILANAKRLRRSKSTSGPTTKTEAPKTNGIDQSSSSNDIDTNDTHRVIKENGTDTDIPNPVNEKSDSIKPAPYPKERSSSHQLKQTNQKPDAHESNNLQPPKSKPRSVTAPVEAPPSRPDVKKPRPPTPPKESPKPRAMSQSTTTHSPVPSRRKPAAPKPPGPPPTSSGLSRTPSAPPRIGKTPPPKPAGRVPPPRPRPPSIKKKLDESKPASTSEYDDALNPFAIEEEEEEKDETGSSAKADAKLTNEEGKSPVGKNSDDDDGPNPFD